MKTFHWLIAISFAIPLFACGGDDNDDKNTNSGGSNGGVAAGGTGSSEGNGGTGSTSAGGGGAGGGGGGSVQCVTKPNPNHCQYSFQVAKCKTCAECHCEDLCSALGEVDPDGEFMDCVDDAPDTPAYNVCLRDYPEASKAYMLWERCLSKECAEPTCQGIKAQTCTIEFTDNPEATACMHELCEEECKNVLINDIWTWIGCRNECSDDSWDCQEELNCAYTNPSCPAKCESDYTLCTTTGLTAPGSAVGCETQKTSCVASCQSDRNSCEADKNTTYQTCVTAEKAVLEGCYSDCAAAEHDCIVDCGDDSACATACTLACDTGCLAVFDSNSHVQECKSQLQGGMDACAAVFTNCTGETGSLATSCQKREAACVGVCDVSRTACKKKCTRDSTCIAPCNTVEHTCALSCDADYPDVIAFMQCTDPC